MECKCLGHVITIAKNNQTYVINIKISLGWMTYGVQKYIKRTVPNAHKTRSVRTVCAASYNIISRDTDSDKC